MDSYDLFGEDGTGMLEGLPDLGTSAGFDPSVTGGSRNAAPGGGPQQTQQQAYQTQQAAQQQQQPPYQPQPGQGQGQSGPGDHTSPLQKLASFGGGGGGPGGGDPSAAAAAAMYGAAGAYGAGPTDGRGMGPPPHSAQANAYQRMVRPPPSAAAPTTPQYPYQTDSMYSMPDVQAAAWSQHGGYPTSAASSMHRYGQMGGPGAASAAAQYGRQMGGYPAAHQQEQKQQFPGAGSQHPAMMQQAAAAAAAYQMQQRHAAAAAAAASHYPQVSSGGYHPSSASGGQSYAGYMHQRLPAHHPHAQYSHHQMAAEMAAAAAQYGQMGGAGPTASHMGGQPPSATGHMGGGQPHQQQQQPPGPSQMGHAMQGYGQPHQTMQQQMQRQMELPPSQQQQFQTKHSTGGPMGNVSPQYRAAFPQLSPQMSPRSQMSPRPPAPSQMSPRPVMSPAKPNMSPHPSPAMQQTTLSPRPASSLTPKVTASSPAPPYSQQSTLQALEQMVMPPSSASSTEYPPYQPRSSLGPPQGPQGMRNPMTEQQWPPMQPTRQPTLMSTINGSMGMMDQAPLPPTSQNIPSTQTLPPSSIPSNQMPQPPAMNVGYSNEDLRGEVNKPPPPTSMAEMSQAREREASTPQGIPSQSEFSSVQSPTTSIPDKLPSSTTNTEINVPTSTPSASSHPPTPTPTSTTDDNATNMQDTSLPSNSDSIKQIDELSNTSSTSQQQIPSQSNTAHNFTDFNCVSSMTGYASQPSTPKKMDDLVQSNVSIFSQENSVSQESLPESNKSDRSSVQSPRLQSPMSHRSTPVPSSVSNTIRETSNTPTYVSQSVTPQSPHNQINQSSPVSSQAHASQILPNVSQHLNSMQNQQQNVPQLNQNVSSPQNSNQIHPGMMNVGQSAMTMQSPPSNMSSTAQSEVDSMTNQISTPTSQNSIQTNQSMSKSQEIMPTNQNSVSGQGSMLTSQANIPMSQSQSMPISQSSMPNMTPQSISPMPSQNANIPSTMSSTNISGNQNGMPTQNSMTAINNQNSLSQGNLSQTVTPQSMPSAVPHGMPSAISQGMPPMPQGMSPTPQGLQGPPTSQGMPLNSQGIPPMSQGMPPTSQEMVPTSQGMPPTSQGLPPSQSIAPTSQGMPPTSQGMLPMSQGVSLSSQGMAPVSQVVPPTGPQNIPSAPQNQSGISNMGQSHPMPEIRTHSPQTTIPTQNVPQKIKTPPSQLPSITQIPPHAQNMPPHQTNIFDQSSQMMGRALAHGMPPMGHPGMPMGMGMMNMGGMMGQDMHGYQPPISHQQERAALQQQLQELYCMPPAPEHQEKIARLQERLNVLSQHEATEQCNGGPQCVLQSPLFTSPMIDSPQVSSTTGRGRKGAPKGRKPRAKKGEKPASPIHMSPTVTTIMPMNVQQPQQLPVSEDFVTPGAGLSIPSGEMSEFTELGVTAEGEKKKGRKPREPKKPKEPKEPKAPKSPKEPKEKKERKKREPKEPRIKRKYIRKKKGAAGGGDEAVSEESVTDESINKSLDIMDDIPVSIIEKPRPVIEEAEAEAAETKSQSEADSREDSQPTREAAVAEKPLEMQADSQTPAEGAPDAKKDEYIFDDQPSPEMPELPKRPKRPPRPSSSRKSASGVPGRRGRKPTGRKKRGSLPESDGEGEDLISTPPPSPPEDSESSSTKRRSARNTQRKKYIDDVMLRFSDDDTPATPTRSRKAPVPATPPAATAPSQVQAQQQAQQLAQQAQQQQLEQEQKEQTDDPDQDKEGDVVEQEPAASTHQQLDENSSADPKNQMNYVYVNTTEEDSMVVQYVLASRMSKRPKKSIRAIEEKKPPSEESEEGKEPKDEGEEDKEEDEKEDKEDKEVTQPEIPPEPKASDTNDEDGEELVEVEEYFVKYRNFSYLHCEWKTEDELFKGDKRIGNKIKRFKQKQAQQINIFENLEEEPFNPDYVEVDRVLDVSEHTDTATGELIKHYLVKWRALQYEDCTWELEEDVDPVKIEQYIRFNKIPPKDQWKPKKRPPPDQWVKLDKSPIYKGGNSLREYQLEGLNWLLFSWYNGRNCILADEMGLGKTIQSLTFLNSAWEAGIRGPFLVIAPLSTIPNWQREIESWTDMNVIVYHGSATSKNMIQEYEMFYKNDNGRFIKDMTKFNVLITTFEIIVTDFADLRGFNWRICVIDEAHRLKNRNCKLLEGLRQLNLEHRVLLSGTPLQNNVNELFSLLNFLEPTQFSNCEAFLQEFGALRTEQEVQKLQCLLKPMMLRRLKEDVEKSLAPKEETVVEVELTNIQKKYYRGILERNFSFLSKGTTHANIPNLMNTMMELRKCCIHPYLLNGAEEQIQYDFKNQHGDDPDSYYKSLINSSGKMVLIDKLLPKLKANGHRVLVFSQMVKCLDILEDYLMYRKYPFERIDGRIRGNLRQAAIDRFSRPDSDRFVFLLCTKAGGLGINLTAADTVIIYDSDWNPQNDLQAQARCHRIGQQKMVKIYRLLCRNTYEREMFDKASLKLGLDKAILQSMNTSQNKDAGNRQLSKKEIEDLLKKGAYGALLDEDDGDKFCEEDIDVILERRTQVITMESEQGSTFSKASFASSANRSDIAIDDPDFWNKWAKKAEIDTTEKDESEELVLSEPRRRTQIKRYGHDENAIDMSELESSSDSDPENEGLGGGLRSRRHKLKKKKYRPDDYIPRSEGEQQPRGDIVYGSWARRECFMVERGLLTFGWGRWNEILQHSQLRKGWRESDIEDCARVILLYCLRFYRGDEKIRSFIWDLITPSENGEQKISRNHHGLKDPVPRGIRNKHKRKDGKGILSKDARHPAITDPNHWSKNEKYDGDIFLESNYKKHLGRHANKVLLRVRMLYYIKHEIIGEMVQHIAEGVSASALPIYPPVTEQLPSAWWDSECDRSLLVGTWKHGYEMYDAMRSDPALCFLGRCGPPPTTAADSSAAASASVATPQHNQPDTPQPIGDASKNLNEDDLDDEDGDGESSSVKTKNRDPSDANSEIAEPSPGPSASSETQPMDSEDRALEEGEDKIWPTVTDLNTRLRRVITSYQRNCRKEEQKLAALKSKQPESSLAQQQSAAAAAAAHQLSSPLAALAQVSQQFDPRDAAALGLQGWDLQQLALYLLMERQGKQALEQQVPKEREKLTINKRWTKREEADFFRVVSSYGVVYYRKKKAYDWTRFKQLAKLEKKSDEELTDYYKNFVIMCKKQTGMNVDESSYDNTIEHIVEEKARRTLERLELLSRIREEVLTHPKLDERLRVCLMSADMPDWWIPGKHDKDLLLGVAKHGLGRTDYYLLNDPDLSFHEVLRKKVRSNSLDSKDAIKLESHEDILKFDKDEILVKLEKGEGTLKIEKVAVKKEASEDKKSGDEDKVNLTIVKSEKCETKDPVDEKVGLPDQKEEEDKEAVKEGDEDKEESTKKETDTKSESEKFESDTESKKSEVEDLSKVKPEKSKSPPPKAPSTDPEADLCSKQAAELKAMFPDLEVIQPLSRLSQVDTFVLRDKQGSGALDFSETTVAQLFNNAVKWPKEYAIQVRLQHIIYAVETKEWPAAKSFSAYATGIGGEFDVPIHELPNEPPKRERDTSTPMSSVGEPEVSISVAGAGGAGASGGKKRKRHIAIDVETERAKLHALLNSSHATTPPVSKHGMQTWGDNDDSEDSRRSTPVQSTLQPPPAHQQTSRSLSITSMKMPYDLQYHSTPAAKTIGQTTVIPGTSSTLTPIDLSSSIPKNTDKPSAGEIQNEVQDFSVKKPTTPTPSTAKSSNKLDDTLSKLMKRKNCPEPEPLVGKEKKRRKLDEIVLGLSAAKEQSLFPVSEPSKKPPVTPSVTVTPASAPVTTSHSPAQKPFTITVTSVPSTSKGGSSSSGIPNLLPQFSGSAKDSFSTFLAQAEQQNLLLKKQQQQQQQQRKSYEAMIADIGKVSDFSSKVNSYSHEAKVNKWLAEQNAALAEQPLSADYLSPRRRRPRVDPTLLDWKKLTGDENVAVIHRVTGKKLTGPKAPTLKRLGQWLMENPMYDIDPKWAELVKERGNLSHDLQKRLSAQQGSAGVGASGGGGKNKQGGVPGRPSILSSPTGSTSSVNSGNLATSLSSSMSFPSLSSSSLAGLNSNLLTGLSAGLGQFDPKTNPLLMPFAGLPNMGALGSMGGLGNLTNMNLFANLAGLGLPGLGGMDPAALASAAAAAESAAAAAAVAGKGSSKGGGQGGQSKQSKPQEAHASSKSGGGSGQGQSAAAMAGAANPAFPFFFPNPSLLYTPLGLGGLNPFTLQPGMSAAYDSLAQQCGLLNGGLNPAASPNSSSTSSKISKPSSSSRPPSASATTPTPTTSSSPQMKPPSRSSSRDAHLQQLLLPPDTQILESISKAASSLDITLKQAKGGGGGSDKKDEKRKQQQQAAAAAAAAAAAFDSFRGMLPSDFTVQKKTGLPGLADFTKLLEAQVQVSQATKKTHEQQMKEALEQLTKSNQELVAKALAEEQPKASTAMKRPREASIEMFQTEKSLMPAPAAVPSDEEPLQPPHKKAKEEESRTPSPRVQAPSSVPTPQPQQQVQQQQPQHLQQQPQAPPQQHHDHEGVDIEALLPPSTVVKSTGLTPEKKTAAKEEKAPPPPQQPSPTPTPHSAKEEETENETETSPAKATVEEQPAASSPPKEEASKPQEAAAPTATVSADENETSPPAKKGAKRTRGKRKSGEIIIDPESIVAKKNLRSSASRSAAAAAARQKLEAENAQRERNEESANANS